MVDIPTADQIDRISPRSGRVDSRGPSPVMGQALAGFGQDLQRTSANLAVANYNMNVLAERQAQDEQKKRASDVSTSLTRFLSDWEQRFITARDEAPESGIGFTHAFMDGYQKQANAFAKDHFEGLGEEDQNRYLNAILTHGNALFDKAHAFEQATKSDYYGRITDQNLQTIGTQIAGNASNYDALKQQGIEAIDSVDMPEAWKADRRAKWAAEAERNRFLWDYSQDPQQAIRAMNPVGLSGDAKEVIRQEEGFRPQAYWDVNHWRVGYGSDTYTTADGQVHEVTQDTVISQADAERDLERRSQEFSDKAAAQVGPGWNTLPGNVQAALTSVAYNYGTLPNSVAAAARSGDVNATANAIENLPDNPDRRQREATIAREGAAGTQPSRYSAMSVDSRRKLADWGETQYRSEVTKTQAQARDYWRLQLATNPESVSEQGILTDPRLDAGDKATLVSSWRAATKENAGSNAFIARLSQGPLPVNPFDSEQTKIADKAFDRLLANTETDQDQAGLTTMFVQRTGYIPKRVEASIRYGAASADPNELANAMSDADQLQRAAPKAFTALPSDVNDKLVEYRHFVNDTGMAPDEAAKRILMLNDPNVKRDRAVMKPVADKFVKGLSVDDATHGFAHGLFNMFGPDADGMMPAQRNALMSEFQEAARERFYETGDTGAAKALAQADMQKTWGVTQISGEKQLMRLPPEKVYPAVDGSYAYLRDDALATAEQYVKDTYGDARKVENIALMPDQATRADIAAGRPPRYRLFYSYQQDGQTLFDEVYAGYWGVDAASIQAMHAKAQEKTRAEFGNLHQAVGALPGPVPLGAGAAPMSAMTAGRFMAAGPQQPAQSNAGATVLPFGRRAAGPPVIE